MMGSLSLAAALLLGGAGFAKLATPGPAATMLRRGWRRLPAQGALSGLMRSAGVVEIAVAVAVVVDGGRWTAVLLAAAYAIFTVVALRLLRTGPRTSCGCFGRADSPIGIPHLVVDIAAVAVAVASLIRPPGRVGGLLDDGALSAVIGVGQAVILAYLAFVAMTALPALAADRRRVAA
jgi:hypothetical protein